MATSANTITGYSVSKDYKRLTELARHLSAVCFVDYRVGEGEPIRDIAKTLYSHHHDEEVFMISARGTLYIHASGEDEFVKFCSSLNVEFIEPLQAIADMTAVIRAYGHLWHVSTDPAAPVSPYSPERVAAEARKALLPLLTNEQRGEAINAVGRDIGRYPGGDDHAPLTDK